MQSYQPMTSCRTNPPVNPELLARAVDAHIREWLPQITYFSIFVHAHAIELATVAELWQQYVLSVMADVV
jgi:hypothetical protein